MRAWREKWGAWKDLERAWKELGKVLESKTVVLVYAWTRGHGQLESLEAEQFQYFEVSNSPRFRASKLQTALTCFDSDRSRLRSFETSKSQSFKASKLQAFEFS